jgi:hypothetical protein
VNEGAIKVTSGIINKTEDSTTRLTVWDSTTGNMHHLIRDICCITSALSAVHPSNVNICATAGDRGIVKVWDVVTGTLITSHTLTSTNQYTTDTNTNTIAALGNKVDVTDINFAPDGSAIVVSDSHGRIHTFGDKTCNMCSDYNMCNNTNTTNFSTSDLIVKQYCSAGSSDVKSDNSNALNPYCPVSAGVLDQTFCKVLYI